MRKIFKAVIDGKVKYIYSENTTTDKIYKNIIPLIKSIHKDFPTFTENHIFSTIKKRASDYILLQKARKGESLSQHKYIKRTGTPGNYKYWYKLPDGRIVSRDHNQHVAHHEKMGNPAPDLPKKRDFHGHLGISRKEARAKKVGDVVENEGTKWEKTDKNKNRWERVDSSKEDKSDRDKESYQGQDPANIVGKVDYGKYNNPDSKKHIDTMLENTSVLLDSMGVKFKTPINLKIGSDSFSGGVYKPSDRQIVISDIDIDKKKYVHTFIHEVGHALDHAMSASEEGDKMYRSDFYSSNDAPKEVKENFSKLKEIIKESGIYRTAITDKNRQKYYDINTEAFARGFEVYALIKTDELIKSKKIPSDFLNVFDIELFRKIFASKKANKYIGDIVDNKINKLKETEENWSRFSKDKDYREKIGGTEQDMRDKHSNAKADLNRVLHHHEKTLDKEKPGKGKEVINKIKEEYKTDIKNIFDNILKDDKVKKARKVNKEIISG